MEVRREQLVDGVRLGQAAVRRERDDLLDEVAQRQVRAQLVHTPVGGLDAHLREAPLWRVGTGDRGGGRSGPAEEHTAGVGAMPFCT